MLGLKKIWGNNMKLFKNGVKCMKLSELGTEPAAVEGASCLGIVRTYLQFASWLPCFIDEDTDFVGIVSKNMRGSQFRP